LIVGDWAAFAQQHPDWFTDNVHYNSSGSAQRSAFVAKLASSINDAVASGQRVVGIVETITNILDDCDLGIFDTNEQRSEVSGLPANENSPIALIANPDLVNTALGLETLVGRHIRYGASTLNWLTRGRRGNFGHGDKDEWLSMAQANPAYSSLDCSGFVNVVLYQAYGINFDGCTYDYKHLTIDGQLLTSLIMSKQINPALLQPGDFIVKINSPCGSTAEVNHMVMVISVSGETIKTIESHAGENDGVEVRERSADWYNQNWPDLFVSRWVGPGAIEVSATPPPPGS
jgi:hypothetical protein